MKNIRYGLLTATIFFLAAGAASAQTQKMPIRTADLTPAVHADKSVLPTKGGKAETSAVGRQASGFAGKQDAADRRKSMIPMKSASGEAGTSPAGRPVIGSSAQQNVNGQRAAMLPIKSGPTSGTKTTAGGGAAGQPSANGLPPIKSASAGQKPVQP